MKSIGIDFSNKMLCILTKGQQGTERAIEELSDRTKFDVFIPEKFRNHTSYANIFFAKHLFRIGAQPRHPYAVTQTA